jgi:hypothetical protein
VVRATQPADRPGYIELSWTDEGRHYLGGACDTGAPTRVFALGQRLAVVPIQPPDRTRPRGDGSRASGARAYQRVGPRRIRPHEPLALKTIASVAEAFMWLKALEDHHAARLGRPGYYQRRNATDEV